MNEKHKKKKLTTADSVLWMTSSYVFQFQLELNNFYQSYIDKYHTKSMCVLFILFFFFFFGFVFVFKSVDIIEKKNVCNPIDCTIVIVDVIMVQLIVMKRKFYFPEWAKKMIYLTLRKIHIPMPSKIWIFSVLNVRFNISYSITELDIRLHGLEH